MTLRVSSCVQQCPLSHGTNVLGHAIACRCKAIPSLTQEGKLPPAMKKLKMKCSMSRGIWHGCCHVGSKACLHMQKQWVNPCPLVVQRVNLLKRLCGQKQSKVKNISKQLVDFGKSSMRSLHPLQKNSRQSGMPILT